MQRLNTILAVRLLRFWRQDYTSEDALEPRFLLPKSPCRVSFLLRGERARTLVAHLMSTFLRLYPVRSKQIVMPSCRQQQRLRLRVYGRSQAQQQNVHEKLG